MQHLSTGLRTLVENHIFAKSVDICGQNLKTKFEQFLEDKLMPTQLFVDEYGQFVPYWEFLLTANEWEQEKAIDAGIVASLELMATQLEELSLTAVSVPASLAPRLTCPLRGVLTRPALSSLTLQRIYMEGIERGIKGQHLPQLATPEDLRRAFTAASRIRSLNLDYNKNVSNAILQRALRMPHLEVLSLKYNGNRDQVFDFTQQNINGKLRELYLDRVRVKQIFGLGNFHNLEVVSMTGGNNPQLEEQIRSQLPPQCTLHV
jgi:hypothetical protein